MQNSIQGNSVGGNKMLFLCFLQASAAETAESEESKGSPGFFSQVLSELAAPLYEEDESDFLSDDSSCVNPSPEDDIREKDKNKDSDDSPSVDPSAEDNNQEEDDNINNEEPQFASSEYMSVSGDYYFLTVHCISSVFNILIFGAFVTDCNLLQNYYYFPRVPKLKIQELEIPNFIL